MISSGTDSQELNLLKVSFLSPAKKRSMLFGTLNRIFQHEALSKVKGDKARSK
jgi:hypothetical protein